jgi:hypothetical protein
MKKILLIAMLFCMESFAHDVELEVKSTYVKHTKSKYDKAYHIQKDGFKNEMAVSLDGEVNSKMEYKVKLSNRLEDTIIDKALLTYDDRSGKHIYQVNLGTVQSMKGIFDSTQNATVQPPMIHKSSGVYNDEFIAGFLDTTVGIEPKYSYLLDSGFLFTLSGFYSDIRVTDKSKAEKSMFNYESDVADVEFRDKIKQLEFSFEYGDNFMFFRNVVESKFYLVPTHNYSKNEILAMYMMNSPLFEKPLIFTSGTPYEFQIDRAGGVYKNTNIILGYEQFDMTVEHSTNGFLSETSGWYAYGGWFMTDYVTPYGAYAESKDNEKNKHKEHTIGVRTTCSDNLTTLIEYRKTDWVQTDTHSDYEAYKKSVGGNKHDTDTELIAIEVIYTF